MELIIFLAGLVLLDVLAMRFGVDSRILGVRDGRGWWPDLMNGDVWHDAARAQQARLYHEANVQRLARLASVGRPPVRIRLAEGLRALAVRVDPTLSLPDALHRYDPGEVLTACVPRNGAAHVLRH